MSAQVPERQAARNDSAADGRLETPGYGASCNVKGQEDDNDDDAAASDDETSSDFSSVSGDSLPPIYAYGHTYHGSERCYVPNDAAEDKRLRLQHELYKLCLGGRLHAAKLPIETSTENDGKRNDSRNKDEGDEKADSSGTLPRPKFHILDVGSGNGVWAVDAARRYPHADILGTDLTSALLPKDVPPNLTFEIADAAEPWPPRLYDFIHMRNLVGGGVRDWPRLASQALAHLKPGGTLEFSEIRPIFYDVDPAEADLPAGETPVVGAASREFQRRIAELSQAEGIDFDPVPKVSDWLTGSGAEGVRERVDWLPVKQWGSDPIMRQKGEILTQMIDVGLECWTMMLFGKSGWDENKTRALLQRVREEMEQPKLLSYLNLTYIMARKPRTADENGGGRCPD